MARVKSSDTGPERRVRAALWRAGLRYRLQAADLPGKPDLAFPGRRAAVFVHGCFWHGHDCPRGARQPKNNADYWRRKIDRNRARDQAAVAALTAAGWAAFVVWECEIKRPETLAALIDALKARPISRARRSNFPPPPALPG